MSPSALAVSSRRLSISSASIKASTASGAFSMPSASIAYSASRSFPGARELGSTLPRRRTSGSIARRSPVLARASAAIRNSLLSGRSSSSRSSSAAGLPTSVRRPSARARHTHSYSSSSIALLRSMRRKRRRSGSTAPASHEQVDQTLDIPFLPEPVHPLVTQERVRDVHRTSLVWEVLVCKPTTSNQSGGSRALGRVSASLRAGGSRRPLYLLPEQPSDNRP